MQYPWDDAMVGIRRSLWLRWRRLSMFGFKKSNRILDLGCGDGLDIEILRGWGLTNIVGVDISPKLLAAAKKRNPGVRFIRASADNLPFKDGAFDVVLADSMLYHIVGNKKAIREIRRVLVPHGRACIIEAHQSWLRRLFNALTFSRVGSFVPYLKKRKQAYLVERKGITLWYREGKFFLQQLEPEGFQKEFLKTDFLSVIGKYRKR